MDLERKMGILITANERLENENRALRMQLQSLPNVKALVEEFTYAKQVYGELHNELQQEIDEYKQLNYELYTLKQEMLKNKY